MSKHISIARPYAKAAFCYAKEQKDIPAWKVFLHDASSILNDKVAAPLLTSPACSTTLAYELFHAVLKSTLNEARTHFLRLLIQNKRWIIFPDIVTVFSMLDASFEKCAKIRVVTAVDPSETFKKRLAEQLSAKMNQKVTLTCEQDPAIIGGAIIYIDNKVIDGSLRGKLNRLLEFTLR